MASKFWDNFKKGTAIAGTTLAGGAIVAGVANSLMNSRRNRKKQEAEIEIQKQDAMLRQQKALLDQEIKLRELELKEHQIDVEANKDISLQQMKSQTAMGTTYMTTNADVQKANVMFNENSALSKNGNKMVYDQSSGVLVDSRNINGYPMNMGLMGAGAMYPMCNQQHSNKNGTMSQMQQKLLEAKQMFDQGMINEKEFNEIKANLIKNFC